MPDVTDLSSFPLLRFSYLAHRDHLDVTMISHEVYRVLGWTKTFDPRVKGPKLQVLREIRHDCRLVPAAGSEFRDRAGAIYSFRDAEGPKSFLIVPTENRISLRAPEERPPRSAWEFIDGVCHLRRTYSESIIYTLMVLGKELILHRFPGSHPRVIVYEFDALINGLEVGDVRMTLTPLKMSFVRLDVFHDGAHFGSIKLKI